MAAPSDTSIVCMKFLWIAATLAPICFAQNALEGVRLLKDAKPIGGGVRLVGTKKYQTGAAWMPTAQAVSNGFETRFRFRLSQPADNEYGGADGFAFVLQTMGTSAIAGRGAAGGFSLGRGPNNPKKKGIPRSLAVFFDTFKNDEEEDLSGNSIGIFTNGDGVWMPRRLAINARLGVNLKDGQDHEARIVYQRPQLSVYLDQNPEAVLSAAIDIASVTGSEGAAFVGFTAATGEGFQNHDILDWDFKPGAAQVSSSISFSSENCLPERTLCTPQSAKVEQIGPGRYSVVLPAHLEWGASIEAPSRVRLTHIRGTACWDPQAKANRACTGPEGDPAHARAGLLDPAASAGSLVQQRRGNRLYFSVNGLSGAFEKNEGYYEFEVELSPSR